MTFKRHWLLSFGGTVAGGKDIWSNNIRMMNEPSGVPDTIPGAVLETLLDDMTTDVQNFIRDTRNYVSTAVTLTWVKLNEINELGHYADTTNTHARYLTTGSALPPVNGINSSTFCPSYQTVAVTTTTARQRGPGSKGRFFIPQCAPPLNTDGTLTTLAQTNIAAGAAAFLTALADESGVDVTAIRPAVVSNVGSPGPTEPITGVAVGNVPDVQRRRKSNIIEGYTKATVSA